MFAVQYHVKILLAVKIDCSDAVQRCIKELSENKLLHSEVTHLVGLTVSQRFVKEASQ